MEIEADENSISVVSKGETILSLCDFPVEELREQLHTWLASVTEESAESFVFQSGNNSQTGIFRIEPRSNGWQFTSVKELKRSNELLSLQEWQRVLNSVL